MLRSRFRMTLKGESVRSLAALAEWMHCEYAYACTQAVQVGAETLIAKIAAVDRMTPQQWVDHWYRRRQLREARLVAGEDQSKAGPA